MNSDTFFINPVDILHAAGEIVIWDNWVFIDVPDSRKNDIEN